MNKIIAAYLFLINVITFAFFAADKWKAVHGQWRVKEATLLTLSMIGGSAGALLAMYLVHHKTQKKKFTVSIPMMMIIQVAILLFIMTKSLG